MKKSLKDFMTMYLGMFGIPSLLLIVTFFIALGCYAIFYNFKFIWILADGGMIFNYVLSAFAANTFFLIAFNYIFNIKSKNNIKDCKCSDDESENSVSVVNENEKNDKEITVDVGLDSSKIIISIFLILAMIGYNFRWIKSEIATNYKICRLESKSNIIMKSPNEASTCLKYLSKENEEYFEDISELKSN